MKKQGVDVIIGTHPHTVQAIEYDELAGTLVAYSLGDFFGDASRGGTNYSIILDLEITKDSSTGTTKVTNYSYTPIYTVSEAESSRWLPPCSAHRQDGGSMGGKLSGQSEPVGERKHGPRAGSYRSPHQPAGGGKEEVIAETFRATRICVMETPMCCGTWEFLSL